MTNHQANKENVIFTGSPAELAYALDLDPEYFSPLSELSVLADLVGLDTQEELEELELDALVP